MAIDPWSFRSLSIQHPRQDLLRPIVPLSEKFEKPLIISHRRPGAELLAIPRTRPGQEETRKKKKRPIRVFMTFFLQDPETWPFDLHQDLYYAKLAPDPLDCS